MLSHHSTQCHDVSQRQSVNSGQDFFHGFSLFELQNFSCFFFPVFFFSSNIYFFHFSQKKWLIYDYHSSLVTKKDKTVSVCSLLLYSTQPSSLIVSEEEPRQCVSFSFRHTHCSVLFFFLLLSNNDCFTFWWSFFTSLSLLACCFPLQLKGLWVFLISVSLALVFTLFVFLMFSG